MLKRCWSPSSRWLVVSLLVALFVAVSLVAADARAGLLFRNTVLLALGACGLALPLGGPLAWLVFRTDAPGRRGVLALVATLLFLPLYVQAAGWDAGCGRGGWCGLLLTGRETVLLDGWRAAIWIHGLAAVPWVVLIVGLGFQFVEPELEEAALLDTSPLGVLFRVTLARAIPSLMVAVLWVFVLTAGEMTVTDLFQIRTYAEEVYTAARLFQSSSAWEDASGGNVPRGASLVAILVLASLAAAAFLAPPVGRAPVGRRRRFALGRWRWLGCAYGAGLALLLTGVPLAALVSQAGVVVEHRGDAWIRSWSGQKLLSVVVGAPLRFSEEYRWSALIAALAATLAVAVGIPLAWWARRRGVAQVSMWSVVAVCLALPGPVIGLRVIWLLNRGSSSFLLWLYERTVLPPVLAEAVRSLPLATLICWYGFQSLSEDVLEAATLDGAGPVVRFWRIVVPQRAAALAAAWLAALAISVGELPASLLTMPPGVTTVPLRVFGLLHAGVDDQVAGICLNVALGVFLAVAVMGWLLRPRGE